MSSTLSISSSNPFGSNGSQEKMSTSVIPEFLLIPVTLDLYHLPASHSQNQYKMLSIKDERH